jgi:peptidoglycan DL-endopeptidase CwlO
MTRSALLIALIAIAFFLKAGPGASWNKPVGDSLISFSKQQLGVKYKWAHASPEKGFDCSGFVFYVFSHFNIPVPRASMHYEKTGRTIHADSCRPGDIIVFTGTDPKIRKAGHVGIVLSGQGNNICFIHSSSSPKKPGVKISTFKESPAYRKRFIRIVRVTN